MMNKVCSFTNLPDRELLAEVTRLASCERRSTACLVASLAELDARRLYLGQGHASMFTYCTQVLHLSEHAAYNRIQAARAARQFPLILERLADGSVHLTAVRLLESHLTVENHRELLDAAQHKSKHEIEQMIVRLHSQPDVAASVRKLPTPTARPLAKTPLANGTPPTEADAVWQTPVPAPAVRPPVVSPLTPERYKVQFTVSKETYDKLRRVQDLMRHSVPNGDPAAIFDRALTVLLEELEQTKLAFARRPRSATATSSASRHVPAAVKRAVWARDGGRCAFIGTHGQCSETGFLEFHHLIPYADGGETSADNLELRCRAHNAYEAERHFGRGQTLFAREHIGAACSVHTNSFRNESETAPA